ncbi:MAG: DUF2029 domain-containing protein [Alphaproteobacteria bacterium]|nr:DUF2029 domain-containing protein [Alphaproteobacteria bacterium]MCB9691700.1 DUF2029 domain-containing protein [Alphaproteobacteria bacterium]
MLWRREVVVGIAGLLLALYALAFAGRVAALAGNGWLDANHLPFGGDFVCFWSAARLALEGRAADAFDPSVLQPVQQAAIPGSEARFLWNYPPTFLLVLAPFGLLGAVAATWAWWATTVPLYLAALLQVVPRWETLVLAGAGSAGLLALAHGQNGFLLTAILVGGLAQLDRGRPVLAGAILGALVIKPHLGVLLPVALAASGSWRAFAATGVSAGVACLATLLAFGASSWAAFVANLASVQGGIDAGVFPAEKLVTPYVLLRTLGASGASATVGQGICTLGVAAIVGWTSWRLGRRPLAWAVLIVGSTLASPYLFDYDLVLLAGAFAFAWVDPSPWGPGERVLWGLAALLPVAFVALYGVFGVQAAPLLLFALLASLAARGVATDT